MSAIFIFLKISSFLLTFGTCIWGWKRIKDNQVRILFCIMLLFFFLSTILFAHESLLDTWIKHILFYIGQFFFYLFIVSLISYYEKPTSNQHTSLFSKNLFSTKDKSLVALGVTSMTNSGIKDWIDFITDQGIQHMLALPLLLLIITTIEMKYIFLKSNALRAALNTFMFAAAALMLIHLMEFIVESQKLLSFLDGDINEILEFCWYFLGLFFFVRGIYQLKHIEEPSQQQNVIHSSI